MTDSANEEILRRLARIEQRVQSLDESSAFAMRPQRKLYTDEIKAILGTGKRRAQLYLAADGTRTAGELATFLGLKAPNASKDLADLEKEGLLEVLFEGSQRYYGKKPIDRTLRISAFVCAEYQLNADGTLIA